MKKTTILLLALAPLALYSQQHSIGIGFRAGLNFANITNASQIGGGTHTGFNAAIFLNPSTKSILSSVTEIGFSQQGYDYSGKSASVMLNYITFAQLMAINITKYAQIQFGMHTAYLLNAKADSAGQSQSPQLPPGYSYSGMLSFYNRFDYGFSVGAEAHPYKGILVGARYNLSLSKLYKDPASVFGTMGQGGGSGSSSEPLINPKNNLIQLYLGYRF